MACYGNQSSSRVAAKHFVQYFHVGVGSYLLISISLFVYTYLINLYSNLENLIVQAIFLKIFVLMRISKVNRS